MENTESIQRKKLYQELVADVKQALASHPFGMLDCKECEEINLWAYWQGGENHLDAKILVVGQDWGAIGTPERKVQLDRICKTTPDNCDYLRETIGISDTDQNLVTLFHSIGYNIESQKYPELFFTNYVIGYRSSKDTGKIPLNAWLNESEPYIQRLIEILRPTVILCLGKDVYWAVRKLDNGQKVPTFKTWNQCIEAGGTQICCGNTVTYAIPLAHPGFFGTSNRNRGQQKANKLDLQLQDWSRFAERHQVYGPAFFK